MSVRTSKRLKVRKVKWTDDLRFYAPFQQYLSCIRTIAIEKDRRVIMKGFVRPIEAVYN